MSTEDAFDLLYPGSDAYRFVRRKGVLFASALLTSAEHAIVEAAARGKTFLPGCCFENAQSMLMGDATRSLVYVEGDVLWEGLAHRMRHAWLTLGAKVVDPTDIPTDGSTQKPRLTCGEFPAARQYCGVRIKRPYVERLAAVLGPGPLLPHIAKELAATIAE